MASVSKECDLSIVPYFTHAFVEKYVKLKSASSGESYIDKGYKYFSEGYIGQINCEYKFLFLFFSCSQNFYC